MKKVLLVCTVLVFASFALLVQNTSASANASLDYIYSFQDEVTGGIKEEMDSDPSQLQTDWAIMAFASVGYDPSTVAKGDKSIVDFASQNICALSSVTDIERKIIALEAANINTQNINGCNLYEKLAANINASTGQIGSGVTSTIFGVLALSAQNQSISANSINYIVAAQQADGGWDSGWGTESNITAQAMMALKAGGYSGDALTRAKSYLTNTQVHTGGVKYDANEWSTESDAFSDAFTLMAIYATGESPTSGSWLDNDLSILDDLSFLVNSDGSYNFNRTYGKMTPVWTTCIVQIALNHGFLPIGSGSFNPYIIKTATPSPSPSSTTTSSATTSSSSTSTGSSSDTNISKNSNSTTPKKITLSSSKSEGELVSTNNADDSQLILKNDKSDKKSNLFQFDWRWIIIALILAFLAGALIRYLQHRYIDEK